jgi:alginate O-acetyltransferase complex protein AlgJ
MAVAADPLALPRVPPPASSQYRRCDLAAYVLFVVAITAMGIGAFLPQPHATLDAENRTLAPWPALSLNRAFITAFDRAFADRFGGREVLLRLHNRVLVRVFGVSPAPNVLIGNEGWLFFKGEDGHAFDRYYRGTQPVADAELQRVVDELRRRERFLAAHGIGYVVTIAPDKATIYPEHLPHWATRAAQHSPLDRLTAMIRADGALHFVDLRPALTAAKSRSRVYYATDSHWNSIGARIAYGELMRGVGDVVAPRLPAAADVTMPPYVPGVDVYHGDLARMTGDVDRFPEPDYAPLWKILAAADARCGKRTDAGKDLGYEWYECNRPGLPRAVVYRDSMAIPLIPLLSENFSRVVYVSSHKLDPAFILREKPDVVIEEMVERAMLAPLATPMPDPDR